MQDLRLIGVQDDGTHVLLADEDGARFRVPLDEALRAAVRRDRPRLGQLQIEAGGLAARDVQDLIRAGLSAPEVAVRSGWTVEKVRKFEVPILAEREYVANLARLTNPGPDGRSGALLEDRCLDRLRGRGVALDAVTWDSSRDAAGVWTVFLTFPAGGRERTASWRFDPKARYLGAVDDDARWLTEQEPAEAIPTPHVPVSTDPRDRVFDIEAEDVVGEAALETHGTEDELTDAVRALSQRGRRRPRRPGTTQVAQAGGQARLAALPQIPLHMSPDVPDQHQEVPERVAEASLESSTGEPDAEEDPAAPSAEEPTEEPGGEVAPHAGRKGRARVPSWDDIVFGTRPRSET